MSLESIRDWVVIIAGILWLILTLVIAAIFAALWWATRKGLGSLDKLITDKARPALARVHAHAALLQDKTSRLPGNTPTPEGEIVDRPARGRGLRLPFRRKRRRLLPFPR